MHRSEEQVLVSCAACGANIAVERDRGFALDDESALCFACAVSRGGVYNEGHDHWDRAPDVGDLAR